MKLQPEIIFQTPNYLVLNKPAGLSVHKDGKREEYTLADWILENFPEAENVGESIFTSDEVEIKKPGIVHRLDKDTSGIILIALTPEAYDHFKSQFKNRQIVKIYHLFAYGNLREDVMIVDSPIGKDRSDFRRRTTRNPRGKVRDARTNIKILQRGKENEQMYIFVEARPQTGRMHQIRVHMRHLNTPIVCDRLYARKKEAILGFDRLALHARQLIFKDLESSEQKFVADYPNDFENAILNTSQN
jgi:23S rRNA pseudouridine1911/1915/1917 synthase